MARVARLSPEQMRRARPIRNPAVVDLVDNGVTMLEGPLRLKGLLGWLTPDPVVKRFELEEVGSFVWSLIDGKRSFESLSKQLQKQFKLGRAEAEVSLDAYLRMLAERGLVSLVVKP